MYPQTCPEGRRLFADVLAQVYSRPSVGLVLGQRRRKLTSIEPARSATLTQHCIGIGWIGLHGVYGVHGRDAHTDLSVSQCHSTFGSERDKRRFTGKY